MHEFSYDGAAAIYRPKVEQFATTSWSYKHCIKGKMWEKLDDRAEINWLPENFASPSVNFSAKVHVVLHFIDQDRLQPFSDPNAVYT